MFTNGFWRLTEYKFVENSSVLASHVYVVVVTASVTMDSSLNLLEESVNLRDMVDVSETSWIVTE